MPIAASEATKLENLQSIVNQLSICGISEISGEIDSEGAVIMIITEKPENSIIFQLNNDGILSCSVSVVDFRSTINAFKDVLVIHKSDPRIIKRLQSSIDTCTAKYNGHPRLHLDSIYELLKSLIIHSYKYKIYTSTYTPGIIWLDQYSKNSKRSMQFYYDRNRLIARCSGVLGSSLAPHLPSHPFNSTPLDLADPDIVKKLDYMINDE